MVAAWCWLDRPAGSLLMAAAIAVRPSLGLFLIWQLLRRRWHAAIWTIGGGIALILLTLPFVGLQGYEDYLAVLRNLRSPSAHRRIATSAASCSGSAPARRRSPWRGRRASWWRALRSC